MRISYCLALTLFAALQSNAAAQRSTAVEAVDWAARIIGVGRGPGIHAYNCCPGGVCYRGHAGYSQVVHQAPQIAPMHYAAPSRNQMGAYGPARGFVSPPTGPVVAPPPRIKYPPTAPAPDPSEEPNVAPEAVAPSPSEELPAPDAAAAENLPSFDVPVAARRQQRSWRQRR